MNVVNIRFEKSIHFQFHFYAQHFTSSPPPSSLERTCNDHEIQSNGAKSINQEETYLLIIPYNVKKQTNNNDGWRWKRKRSYGRDIHTWKKEEDKKARMLFLWMKIWRLSLPRSIQTLHFKESLLWYIKMGNYENCASRVRAIEHWTSNGAIIIISIHLSPLQLPSLDIKKN